MKKKGNGRENKGFISHILNIISKEKRNLLLSFIVMLLFFTFLYGVWILPIFGFGISRMSEIILSDYLFIFFASILSSLLLTFYFYERKNKIKAASVATIGGFAGGIAGFFGAICPICQGIVFVALGTTVFSIPTSFITSYSGVFKLTSILLLSLAVLLKAQSIYTRHCVACKIFKN